MGVKTKMIEINKLKAKFVENGFTQSDIAKKLGISDKTMTARMKSGIFGSDEIDKMVEILMIENPADIFFAKKVN